MTLRILACALSLAAAASAADSRISIERLRNPEIRMGEFFRWHSETGVTFRNEKWSDIGFGKFQDYHRNLQMTECPQPSDGPPLHLLTYRPNSLGLRERRVWNQAAAYKIENPDDLFPPLKPPVEPEPFNARGRVMVFFDQEGNEVKPFRGNVIGEDEILDVNGDGCLERIRSIKFPVGPADRRIIAQMLTVERVQKEPKPLLRVIYNSYPTRSERTNPWGYEIADRDGDGIAEIAFGPARLDVIDRMEVAYRWDASSGAYVGPDGGFGEHFVRIRSQERNAKAEFEHLRATGVLGYRMNSPRSEGDRVVLPEPKETKRKSEPVSIDIDRKTQLPKGFWQMAPDEAALALVERNRSGKHREDFRLAIDRRDGVEPPEEGTLQLSVSTGDIFVLPRSYFLRCDPEGSYLAYAQSWESPPLMYWVLDPHPSFDFRFAEVSYRNALQILQTVWWLNRIRSQPLPPPVGAIIPFGPAVTSTADGSGTLWLSGVSGKDRSFELNGDIWAGFRIEPTWATDYDRVVALNFSHFLLAKVLPDRLGREWSRFDAGNNRRVGPPPADLAARQRPRTKELSEKFLRLYGQGHDRLSPDVARVAIRAAGVLGYLGLKPLVEKVAQEEAVAPEAKRTLELMAAIGDTERLERWAGDSADPQRAAWALHQLRQTDGQATLRVLRDWEGHAKGDAKSSIQTEIQTLEETAPP